MTPQEAQTKIAETQLRQAQEDKVGMKAATTALPGPLRDVFSPAPDIQVNRYCVRRFVDRDFVFLSSLGHPLSSFTAMADGKYKFEPSGPMAWQLCWLLTHSIAELKEQFKKGPDSVKELAADEFGELPIFAIGKVMEAIAKQMEIYASAHLELKDRDPEGKDDGSPPSSSQP